MRFRTPLAMALLLGSSYACSLAHAQGREERGERREERGERREERGERRVVPAPRPAPARFEAHTPGQHPHGAIVRPHAIRVLSPRAVAYGTHQWRHWEHPEFARPTYYWNWGTIHHVTCIAEDSYGDQYPVTEPTFSGFTLANMTAIEDDALDRCNAESGGDASCYLATCSHF